MRIAEFSALTGLSAPTLRYYERQGLLPAPARSGGKRDYDPANIALARMLRAARQADFSISDLRALVTAKDSAARAAVIQRHLRQMDESFARMQQQRAWLQTAAECSCAAPGACALVVPL